MRFQTPNPKGGFSVVELLLIICILGILVGIAFLSYSKHLERAEKAAFRTTVNSTSAAVMLCVADEEEINNPQDYANQPICDYSDAVWPDITEITGKATWGGCDIEQDGDHFRYCAVLGANTTISCTEAGCREE